MISRFFYAMAFVAAFVSCGGNVEVNVCDAGSGGAGGQVVDAGFDAPSDAAPAEDASADGPPPLPFCGDGVTCTDVKGVKCPNGTSCGPNTTCFDGKCDFPDAGPSVASALTGPCNPCDGWWTIDHLWNMCADGQPLFSAKVDCISSACAMPCASWLSSYDACLNGADPACQITVTDVCNDCQIANCHSELVACGDDCTGASTCSDWLLYAGDPQALCARPNGASPLDYMLALSDCACWAATGSCVTECAQSCVDPGVLDPNAPMSNECVTCLQDTSRCGVALGDCFVN